MAGLGPAGARVSPTRAGLLPTSAVFKLLAASDCGGANRQDSAAGSKPAGGRQGAGGGPAGGRHRAGRGQTLPDSGQTAGRQGTGRGQTAGRQGASRGPAGGRASRGRCGLDVTRHATREVCDARGAAPGMGQRARPGNGAAGPPRECSGPAPGMGQRG